LASVILVAFASRVDRTQLRDAFSNVEWSWVLVAIVANALILASWSALWWVVSPRAERPTYGVMFEINAMASALMNTMPLLGGHAAAVVLLIKRGGLTRAGALSVLALDQLGEGLAKVTLFGLVALAAPIPDWMRLSIGTVCVAVGGLLIALVVAAHRHIQIKPDEMAELNMVTRARRFAAAWAERMEALRSMRQSLVALSFALGTKVAEGAGILAAQHAFGLDLTIGSTLLVLAAVTLGAMLPLTPGNVGTYEAGAILAYRHVGVDPEMAVAVALVAHACFMIPSIGIGYLHGSWRGIRLGREALSAVPPAPNTAPDSAAQ
jgi:uncharacterized protein (TIRG00374 family)